MGETTSGSSPKLRQVVDEYAAFERSVGRLMFTRTAEGCASCQRVCCRGDICEEACDSVFLGLVRSVFPPDIRFDDYRGQGWLTECGCALSVGRPPVCYEFLCDDLMVRQVNDDIRYALRTLGMLPGWLGRRALGERHLVALRDHALLLRVKPDRFLKRLAQAREVFGAIERCLECHVLDEEGALLFRRVCPPGVSLYQGA